MWTKKEPVSSVEPVFNFKDATPPAEEFAEFDEFVEFAEFAAPVVPLALLV